MKKIIIFLIILLLLAGCSTTSPEKQKLEVNVTDVSCTEAWIKVSGETGNEIQLKRDEKEVKRFILSTSPQTVYDDCLAPNTTYTYQAASNPNQGTSNEVIATTLDITSNNFTWQSWNIGGEVGSCRLYDAAIINENDIWAVGEIIKADTNENGYTTYNAVHWDGNEWELKIISVLYNGNSITPSLYGIYAFSASEIWLSSGVPIKGDGNNWEQYHLFDMGILTQSDGYLTKIWGSASNNLYYVGTLGTIVHYQNGQWTKIESRTDLSFLDIYGSKNRETGKYEILAVCSRNNPPGNGLYILEGNTATEISLYPIQYDLLSLWFIPNMHYYIVGSGIYEKKVLTDSKWTNEPLDITRYGMSKIRGNSLNDIYTAGAYGEILHFNGVRWKSFMNETGRFNDAYASISVKGDIIIALGAEGQQAKILMGKRIE